MEPIAWMWDVVLEGGDHERVCTESDCASSVFEQLDQIYAEGYKVKSIALAGELKQVA